MTLPEMAAAYARIDMVWRSAAGKQVYLVQLVQLVAAVVAGFDVQRPEVRIWFAESGCCESGSNWLWNRTASELRPNRSAAGLLHETPRPQPGRRHRIVARFRVRAAGRHSTASGIDLPDAMEPRLFRNLTSCVTRAAYADVPAVLSRHERSLPDGAVYAGASGDAM